MPNISDHKQAFSVRFSDHHSNTRPFDNQTQIYHLNIRLVWYLDGYCISVFLAKINCFGTNKYEESHHSRGDLKFATQISPLLNLTIKY